jgi:hypothetical protein
MARLEFYLEKEDFHKIEILESNVSKKDEIQVCGTSFYFIPEQNFVLSPILFKLLTNTNEPFVIQSGMFFVLLFLHQILLCE